MKPSKPTQSKPTSRRPLWSYPLTWYAVVAVALVLAFATPRGIAVMGKLPADVGEKFAAKPVSRLAEKDERFLALVSFHRSQRKDVESWIDGLKLHDDQSIAWVRMPVLDDPVDPVLRAAAEKRVLARYATALERQNLMPVITNRKAFVESAGLRGTGTAYVLVVNRDGQVLARVAGEFDPDKAESLRDTLLMREL